MAASKAAAVRVARDQHPMSGVATVTCGPLGDDETRDCVVFFAHECGSYTVGFDSHHRVQVGPAVATTCYVTSGPNGVIQAG